MEIHERLEQVNDQKSFLAFVKALASDWKDEVEKEKKNPSNPYGPGANGWENGSIDTFLESAVAWAESTNFGKDQGLEENQIWKRFAVFLYCGKI
jgi:hypothetical protein